MKKKKIDDEDNMVFLKGVECLPREKRYLEMMKVLEGRFEEVNSLIRSFVSFRGVSVFDRVLRVLGSLCGFIVRERREFGFGCSSYEEESEEEVFLEDCRRMEFVGRVCEVLGSGRGFLGEDFSGWSGEWFKMEMCLRFGLQEDEVKDGIEGLVREAVGRGFGVLDIRRPVSRENCLLSLLDVF